MTKENQIDFIAAHNGGIQLFSGVGNQVGFATTAKMVAYIVQTKGLAESVFHSSSMDFADEEGFDTYDGAWKLWEAGMELV
jgi:hypothetical protein